MENKSIVKKDIINMFSDFWRYLPRTLKIAFISTFIIGLCAHMFMYTNTLFNHDASAYYENSFTPSALINGRWMAALMQTALSGLSLPWLIGLLTLTFLGFASWLVCEILQIKRTVPVVLISGLMITFPTVTAFNCYLSSAFVFAFAILAACASVYFLEKHRKWGWIPAIFSIVISLACYQAYISMTLSLMILVIVQKILQGEEPTGRIWIDIAKKVVVFVAGILLYYVIAIGLAILVGKTFGEGGYRGEDAIGQYKLAEIPSLLFKTFKLPLKYYFKLNYRSYMPIYVQVLLWAGMAAAVIISISLMVRNNGKKIGKWLTLLFAVICLPIAMAFIQILNKQVEPHALMVYAFVIPWIYMLQVNEQLYENNIKLDKERIKKVLLKPVLSVLILITCLFMIVFGCFVANASYLKLKVNYDSGIAIADRIVARIEETPGYTYDTQVAIVGVPSADKFGCLNAGIGFSIVGHITGVNPMPFSYSYPLYMFITQELQTPMNLVYSLPYYSMPEVQEMDIYPSQECIKWIDGILVMKLSN